ncbi:hypothetical protein [Paraburkholderia strydomiana]|uniref:hypothetical protein n=1 Tax=Paraburkholderia strydomiana TaxID=1245417 RepID=UPI0038B80785
MSEKKISEQEWAAARKRYETEPGLGYGALAQALDCSKSLVARKAREGKWQKDQGVPAQVWGGAEGTQSKVTESAVRSPTQAPGVHAAEPSISNPREVADVFVPAGATSDVTLRIERMTTDVTPGVGTVPTPQPSSGYGDEMRVPDRLDELEREDFIKAAIVARQKAINARHLKEITAARSKLYESLKKAGTKEGPGAALAAQRNVAAMLALQGGEMEAELQRVKLEVHGFMGKPLKPAPCRIVVHLEAGHQIVGGVTAVYGASATEITDVEAS